VSERPEASHHRLTMLIDQGRFAEAEPVAGEVLAHEPDDADTLHLLAFCQYRQDGRERHALETIDRTIAIAPDDAGHHALRALVLVELNRHGDALTAADEAIRLDPSLIDGYTARSRVHVSQQRWAEAEASAREALAIDPDHAWATLLLAESLRLQGRAGENQQAVGTMLSRDPLDPHAHVSAGWAALQSGEREDAERHFLEALRIDPRLDSARTGLLEAFKMRAPWYAAWLRMNLWMARFSERSRWLIFIGLFLLVRFARAMFRGSLAPVGALITVLWLAFALWAHLAPGTANALVLMDSRARHALRTRDRLEAIAVGGGVFVGLALVVLSVALHVRLLAPLGMGLFGAAIPFAHTFTNDSPAGRALFGSVGALALAAGLIGGVAVQWPALVPGGLAAGLGGAALLAVVLSTWLSSVPALSR
jgi:tetratricopeptide (TPR) repeat protein